MSDFEDNEPDYDIGVSELTIEQAVAVLNEAKYRGYSTWYVDGDLARIVIGEGGYGWITLDKADVIVIAQGILDARALAEARKRIGELERRLEVPNDPNADWNNAQLWTATLREVEQLRAERDATIQLLAPACADETLEGAIRNLQQAYLTASENCETLEGMLAALRSAAEWQPIETAPKEHGGQLLLWWPYWRHKPVIGCWWFDHWDSVELPCDGSNVAPTHWMPLPAPPAALGEQRKVGDE